MKKIKKFKIKQNSNNEYSSYHYFIPKSEHIKFADARTLDTEIGDLRNQINELEEKTQYLIDKAPLIGFEEGESSLNLKGCANDEIRKVGIDGQSEQKSYEGYNELENIAITQTMNGVTFTKNNDGTVIANGTATSTSYIAVNNFSFIANQDYKLIGCPAGGSDNSYKMYSMNTSSGAGITDDYGEGGSIRTSTDQVGVIRIRIASGYTANNLLFKPMIVKGTDIKPYEPYVGGQPSPNPEYPQDIEVIDGVNRFDISKVEQGDIDTTTGQDISGTNIYRSEYIKIKPNSNIYIDFCTSSNGYYKRIFLYDKNKNIISTTLLGTSNTTAYIDTSYNAEYLRVKIVGKMFDSQTQIIKGTTSKPYLPYGHIGLRHSGANIFVPTYKVGEESINCVNSTLALQGDEYTLVATGKDMYFGEVVSAGKQYRSSMGTLYNVKGKSKIHLLLTNSKLVSNYITAYDSNKNSLGFSSIKSYRGSYDIPEEAEYITLRFGYANAIVGETYKTKVMLSFEEINNIFKPYHEPKLYPIDLQGNNLAKVGDIKDLLKIYKNGEIEIEKKINKVMLDSSENWTKTNDTTASVFALNNYIFTSNYGANGTGYCNYFIYQFANRENLFYFGYNNNITICMPTSYTLDNFKTWLLTHNTEVYYQLVEPQTISLSNIEPIELWEGTNNFELITNLDTTMKMIYKKDINALIADSGV